MRKEPTISPAKQRKLANKSRFVRVIPSQMWQDKTVRAGLSYKYDDKGRRVM